jgi:hypothetical protein
VESLMAVIDFERACLTWITRSGSVGRWRVIASATDVSGERFVLAPMVMAGDVYGAGQLPHDPPYSFQIWASARRHMILRDSMSASPIDDSGAENSEIFTQLEIHAPALAGPRIDLDRAAAAWPLTARLRIFSRDGAHWFLDFPVNHINHASGQGAGVFQVETGPILVPAALAAGVPAPGGFALAYVFFNRPNRVDLALWGPRAGHGERAYVHFGRLDGCEIEVYASAAQ